MSSTAPSIQLARHGEKPSMVLTDDPVNDILVGPRQLVAERAIGIDLARHHVLREHIRLRRLREGGERALEPSEVIGGATWDAGLV
jgi:hypothetical protein